MYAFAVYFIFSSGEGEKLVELRLVSNLSQMPAAATAATPPHPLPGRQHLIKMARTARPPSPKECAGIRGGGWGSVEAAMGFLAV